MDAAYGKTWPAGGRTGSPTAPTPSTRSRSSRSPPTCRRRGRVLDVGCGEGQVARLAGGTAAGSSSASTRPAQIVAPRKRGGGPVYARPAPTRSVRRRGVRRRRRVPGVRAHRRRRRGDRRGRPGPAARRPLRLLPQPPAAADARQRLDRRPHPRPPEQYWRIGPYLIEDSAIEEVDKDVFIPFIHRPMSRY